MEKAAKLPHISVCICTYKRAHLLKPLLHELELLETNGLFDYSVVVVDNDERMAAREVVSEFGRTSTLQVEYVVEPQQNIALARNKAFASASGDFVAFIDDDELPITNWLLKLFQACQTYKADGVLGPVLPRFVTEVPAWALKAGMFDRPNSANYPSGMVLHWNHTGTGNVLIRRAVFEDVTGPFKEKFGSGGEDVDFFRRAMEAGNVFVWSAEAIAHEIVPAERMQLSFQIRRALLRGKASLANPSGRVVGILKSVCAFPAYAISLPICFLLGRHLFIRNLIKMCDHFGKLLALCRVDIVREKYVLK